MAITTTSTAQELIEELRKNNNTASEIREIIYHNNANEEVFNEIIDISRLFLAKAQSNIISHILYQRTVTTNNLIRIVKNAKEEISIIRAIQHQKSDERVMLLAIKQSLQFNNTGSYVIFLEIIKNKKVTKDILLKMIEVSNSAAVIKAAVESTLADTEVCRAANKKSNIFDSDESFKIQSAVNKKMQKIIKNYNLTQPNPPLHKPTNEWLEKMEDILNQNQKIEQKQTVKKDFIIEEEENVTERLRMNVEDGMSTMLWGLSGIGKTARVREIDPDFTMIKLKNGMLPEEVVGGKEPNGEPGQIYPPYWYVKLCEKCTEKPDEMHILFIDELTNVRDNVKTLVWDIIGDRRVNGNEDWELPDNCAIVAAGNRPEESTAVVTDYTGGVLPEPLHDRFDFHIEIPLDMREWRMWALETNPKTGNLNIHPIVLSFCIARPSEVMFSNLDPKDVTKPRLSPRRWEKLSKAIYMAEKRGGKKCHVSNQRIAECIGKDLAPAFIAHYEREPLNMEKVEVGKYTEADFRNIDDKLFALSSLLSDYNGSAMAVEDFIVTCLGDEYWVIYTEMKKQQNSVSLNKGIKK